MKVFGLGFEGMIMATEVCSLATGAVSILLVDDNLDLGRALACRLQEEGFLWHGQLQRIDFLTVHVEAEGADVNIVLLDLDMPGKDPLQTLVDFTAHRPSIRTIIFTGCYTKELVEAGLRAGARGYVCKIDGEDSLIEGIRAVMDDKIYLSPEACTVQGTNSD